MMSRQVTAFVAPESLDAVIATLIDEVLPIYREAPHFLGFTVVKSDKGPRTEVVAMSYWDDGLEGTAQLSDKFVAQIRAIDGVSAARRSFEIVHASMRDTTGDFCAEQE
jgi:hypothetical protein